MKRPVVAISARPRRPGDVRGWASTEAAAIQYTYLESLWRAGCDEAIIAPRSGDALRAWDSEAAKSFLGRVDALILVGGGDVDPRLYGQEPHETVYDVEPGSDALEIALTRAAVEMRIPVLAICRGMQVVNVALGGTLQQHITGQPGLLGHGDAVNGVALHTVNVVPGSLLSESTNGSLVLENCWSYHHQLVDRLADGLIVSGRSNDNAVEAIEFDRSNGQAQTRGWLLAVQWHPERRTEIDAQQQALFDALAAQARR